MDKAKVVLEDVMANGIVVAAFFASNYLTTMAYDKVNNQINNPTISSAGVAAINDVVKFSVFRLFSTVPRLT